MSHILPSLVRASRSLSFTGDLSVPRFSRCAVLLAALLASACTVGPDYHRPELAVPSSWQARKPHGGSSGEMTSWWQRFNDPVLLELQSAAEKNSPSLDEAVARITKARATLASRGADALPSVSAEAKHKSIGTIGQSSGQVVQTAISGLQGQLDASWEIDLFGKVRRNKQAARALIDARIGDWHDARVSLMAEVADDYAQLRGCQQLARIYEEQARSQGETARLTRINANAGYSPPADADYAEAAAASTRSSALNQSGECDLLVKSLTALTAIDEAALREMLTTGTGTLPSAPDFSVSSVPADLLRQRPDIASQERELAAASADIGVAVADLYPSLQLDGTISLNRLLKQWTFGPALSLPIFQGGSKRAAVTSAKADYDIALAQYRQTVRDAVQEVEEALVKLDTARARESHADGAVQGYRKNFSAVDFAYGVGRSSMLDRESARRDLLDAQLSLANLRLAKVRDWIALYKALGGGWQSAAPN